MNAPDTAPVTRRSFLWKLVAVPVGLVIAACSGRTFTDVIEEVTTAQASRGGTSAAGSPSVILPPTPECGDDDDDDVTIAQTEGPFYTPNSPLRTSLLEDGITGTPMLLTGYVLTTSCQPVANALVDFWHADDAGVYDNVGYRLRGHQFTDAEGRWTLETIVPGLYPGRTRHFHVKVQAANQPVLTTQLYFTGEPANATDGIFNGALVITDLPAESGRAGTFNFVLNLP